MIKPLEESTVMNVSHSFPSGALKPLQRVEMAVNMLIDDVNGLIIHLHAKGIVADHDPLMVGKDPND
mgnify:FL=1